MHRSRLARIALLLACLRPMAGDSASAGDFWIYIGTYTTTDEARDSKGIYLYKFHSGNGKVEAVGLAAERLPQVWASIREKWPLTAMLLHGVQNAESLAIHPNGRYLYTADENKVGTVSAYRIEPTTGKLTLLNVKPSAGGSATFVAIDHTGRNLLVANYGGTVAVLPIDPDGRLRDVSSVVEVRGFGPDRSIQARPHSVNLSPDNRFAIVTDSGLDEILVYRFDANRHALTANNPPFVKTPRGMAPRHFSFHPNGVFGYAIGEMGSTVATLRWDAQRGVFTLLETVSTLPPDYHGWSAGAEILVDANGKFLYASNRGHDSIAVFTIDPVKGTLTAIQYAATQGVSPRSFAIDPTGRYLFSGNARTANVVQFQIDRETGRLTPTGLIFRVPAPVSIQFALVR